MGEVTGGAFVPANRYRMSGTGGVVPSAVTLADSAAIPIMSGVIILSKATAGAYTLAAPTLLQDGYTLVITNATAAAHIVTATTLIADGVTGSPHTTITFGAFKGASITLVACKGLWNVVAAVVAPVT